MKKNIQILVMAMLCLFIRAEAQYNRPINIGDTVPESLWELSLISINQPFNKQEIKLNTYKGKLIILDFWATNCSSCIKVMPRLNALQDSFKDKILILPVSYEKEKQAAIAIKTNHTLNPLNLNFVVEDKNLSQLFPHQYISHLVWIDQAGVVRAFTHSNYVTAENINLLLESKPVNWPVKRDITNFNYHKNLFGLDSAGIPRTSVPKETFHSGVTSHLENIAYRYSTKIDSAKKCFSISLVNFPIKEMYLRILGRNDFPANRILIPSKDRNRFIFDAGSGYQEEWNIANTFCYEGVFPIYMPRESTNAKILADLDFYFGTKTRIEPRETRCLVITGTANKKSMVLPKGNKEKLTLEEAVSLLNDRQGSLPLIDQHTTAAGPIFLEITESQIGNLEALKKALQTTGLQLKEEERTLDFFIIEETGNIHSITQNKKN